MLPLADVVFHKDASLEACMQGVRRESHEARHAVRESDHRRLDQRLQAAKSEGVFLLLVDAIRTYLGAVCMATGMWNWYAKAPARLALDVARIATSAASSGERRAVRVQS